VKWNHPATPWENFQATPSAEVMATVVWDAEGVILVHIMPCGETINTDLYNYTFKTLQKRFKVVQPCKNVAEIFLQHEKVQPHPS